MVSHSEKILSDKLKQWMPKLKSRATAKYRLYCFSHAGGSASSYYSWNRLLPNHIEVCPIQLPGREERLDMAPLTDIEALLDILVPLISSTIDRDYGIYGHSVGALLGFEVANRVSGLTGKNPTHLFVGANRSPCQPYSYPSVKDLSNSELLDVVGAFNGLPADSPAMQEIIDIMLPAIRADLLLGESFSYTSYPDAIYPITVFYGKLDNNVPYDEVKDWTMQTQGQVDFIPLNGDHFFLKTHGQSVLERVKMSLV